MPARPLLALPPATPVPPLSWTPTRQQRVLLSIGGILLVGLLSGLAIGYLDEREEMIAWWNSDARFEGFWTHPLFSCLIFSTLYTALIWTAIMTTRRAMKRRMPLTTWRALAIHMVAILGAAAVTFLSIEALEYAICTYLFGLTDHDAPSFATISIVVSMASLTITALAYLFDFYRWMRDAEQARVEAELRALRAQVNPHFLFNTLNSIAALIRLRPSEAEGVTERLADLFRYTLKASREPTVTLAEDWTATQLYLEIEEIRFSDRLHIVDDVADDVHDACVPSLLLQPLVENAIKHGANHTEGTCLVAIQARRTGSEVHVEVRDSGPGFNTTDADMVLTRGTGLANVQDRLHQHFGTRATLTILPDGVALRFPYHPAPATSTPLPAPPARHAARADR